MTTGAATARAARLRALVDAVISVEPGATDAELVDELRVLEEAKARIAARQAQVAVDFAASQEQAQRDAGVPARRLGRGVAEQVALAKRESPARGRRFVGFSKVLLAEMPHTYAALAAGRTTEWRAQIVVKETIWLELADRRQVDAEIAPLLEGWGDRQVECEVRKRAYRLDPRGFVERSATAAKDRRVTVRPAPDVMSNLNAHLPMGQGVAAYAALKQDAEAKRAAGDERSLGQIMADTLVERVTGQATAEAVPVAIGLVMTDQALFSTGEGADGAGADEPAHLDGYGPVPADLARRLVLAGDAGADAWVQRLYADPETGQLAAIDSRSRLFRGALRKLLVARDQWCRTPWCGAPIRHLDHARGAAEGGSTSDENGQGLCEACNHAKSAVGWSARASGTTGVHVVTTTTPTGHRYRSRPPDPPGYRAPPQRLRRLDLSFRDCRLETEFDAA